MNGKHAYCILAHNEPWIFSILISLLDYPLNDIYIHIDKRVDISLFNRIKTHWSNIFFLKKRYSCNWGSLAIVKAELELFEEARKRGPYEYYHLLSGVDLPLKGQKEIHGFFDKNPSKNFIGFYKLFDENQNECTKFYHFLVYKPGGNYWQRKCNYFDNLGMKIQRKLGIRVHYPFPLYKGSQWVSISDEFLSWLLERRKKILRIFYFSFIPDERFIQSFFMASPFVNTLYLKNGEEYDQCLREIDWERGRPYTWTSQDYDYLKKSKRLFARKFSSKDRQIINSIAEDIRANNISQ